jgi:hypothetical protein
MRVVALIGTASGTSSASSRSGRGPTPSASCTQAAMPTGNTRPEEHPARTPPDPVPPRTVRSVTRPTGDLSQAGDENAVTLPQPGQGKPGPGELFQERMFFFLSVKPPQVPLRHEVQELPLAHCTAVACSRRPQDLFEQSDDPLPVFGEAAQPVDLVACPNGAARRSRLRCARRAVRRASPLAASRRPTDVRSCRVRFERLSARYNELLTLERT